MRDIGDAEQHEHGRQANVERYRCRHEQDERDHGRQMLAHEFEPQPEHRFDRAQQRVEHVRGAALVMPGERHRDDLLERFDEYAGPALMRETVGAAGDQHIGDDVERRRGLPTARD